MPGTASRLLPLLLVIACSSAQRAPAAPAASIRLLDVDPAIGSRITDDTEIRVRAAYTLAPEAIGSVAVLMFVTESGIAAGNGEQVRLDQREGIVELRQKVARVSFRSLEPVTAAVVVMRVPEGVPEDTVRTEDMPPGMRQRLQEISDSLPGNPRVRVRSVTGRVPVRTIARTAAIFYNGSGPATPNRLPPLRFDDAVVEYLTYGANKALAVAVALDGRRQWGYGFGYTTIEEAVARALQECRSRVERFELNAPCELHAVGNQIVGN